MGFSLYCLSLSRFTTLSHSGVMARESAGSTGTVMLITDTHHKPFEDRCRKENTVAR